MRWNKGAHHWYGETLELAELVIFCRILEISKKNPLALRMNRSTKHKKILDKWWKVQCHGKTFRVLEMAKTFCQVYLKWPISCISPLDLATKCSLTCSELLSYQLLLTEHRPAIFPVVLRSGLWTQVVFYISFSFLFPVLLLQPLSCFYSVWLSRHNKQFLACY